MKTIYKAICAGLIVCGTLTSCDDFIDVTPKGVINEELAMSQPEEMVTAAYAKLGDDWYTYPFNLWPYGDVSSDDDHMDELWYHFYCSISRCNRALVSLANDATMDAQKKAIREGEVRFLRAHFYFKLVQMWNQVPWIDEQVYSVHSEEQTRNDEFTHEELMQKIVADFKAAYDVLPTTQDLEDFGDIFLPEYKNSKESIFAVQHSNYEDDNTRFGRANWSNMLNGCWGIWSCGWDFHKPTQNLVNAFKTKDGLPMFDDYNKEIDFPINGAPDAQKWDPRLFHTVGMPTFPYKYEENYTMTTDNSRTPNTYGYYTSLKEVPQRSKGEAYDYPWQAFPMNDYVLRFTDVMLMRAEALIELGQLSEAQDIINAIRQRAKNSVEKHIRYAENQCEIALYPDSYFKDKDTARKCLQWERRLEMAMESSRFFDLRRWGIASQTLNAFFETEKDVVYNGQTYAQYYKDAHFTPGKNEYFPLPYIQLYYVPGLYTQNKGYN